MLLHPVLIEGGKDEKRGSVQALAAKWYSYHFTGLSCRCCTCRATSVICGAELQSFPEARRVIMDLGIQLLGAVRNRHDKPESVSDPDWD
jgi:hypothetical protein